MDDHAKSVLILWGPLQDVSSVVILIIDTRKSVMPKNRGRMYRPMPAFEYMMCLSSNPDNVALSCLILGTVNGSGLL